MFRTPGVMVNAVQRAMAQAAPGMGPLVHGAQGMPGAGPLDRAMVRVRTAAPVCACDVCARVEVSAVRVRASAGARGHRGAAPGVSAMSVLPASHYMGRGAANGTRF